MKLPLVIGPCILMASMLLFINRNLIYVMASMALLGLVQLFMISAAMAFSACLVEPQNREKIAGGSNLVGYLLTGVVMMLGNFFYNLLPQLPFYLTIALSVPMLLIIVFKIAEPKKGERKY